MKLFRFKQGVNRDALAAVVVLFVFGFISILGYYFFNEFITAFTATGLYTGQVQSIGQSFMNSFAMYDYIMVILLVFLVLFIAIVSFKIASRPVFFVVSLLLAIFTGLVSYFFNYIFSQLVSPAIFSAALAVFPRTLLICTNFHWVALIMFSVGSIAMFAKKEQGQFV